MTDRVSYQSDGRVATITMDDGKVNALSSDFARIGSRGPVAARQ